MELANVAFFIPRMLLFSFLGKLFLDDGNLAHHHFVIFKLAVGLDALSTFAFPPTQTTIVVTRDTERLQT